MPRFIKNLWKVFKGAEMWGFYNRQTEKGLEIISFNKTKINRSKYSCAFIVRYSLPRDVFVDLTKRTNVENSVMSVLKQLHVDYKETSRISTLKKDGGDVELQFHMKDTAASLNAMREYARQHQNLGLSIETREGWDYFDTHILPTREDNNRMGDQHVIEQLIKAGADPAKEHAIELVFIGDMSSLRKLSGSLQSAGLIEKSLETNNLVISKSLP